MTDYTIPFAAPVTSGLISPPVPRPNSNNDTTVSNDQMISEFRDLMTMMLLSSFNMSGMSGESGSGFPGMGMNELMAPLMLSLFEKLLAAQVENDQTMPVSAPYGMPIKGRVTQASHPGHVALDIRAAVGTPVRTTMSGKVVFAGWNDQGYGNLIIIENGPYRTYYAHLSKIMVSVDQTVLADTEIGKSGNTGNSTGPHLHYEVRENGKAINPNGFTPT